MSRSAIPPRLSTVRQARFGRALPYLAQRPDHFALPARSCHDPNADRSHDRRAGSSSSQCPHNHNAYPQRTDLVVGARARSPSPAMPRPVRRSTRRFAAHRVLECRASPTAARANERKRLNLVEPNRRTGANAALGHHNRNLWIAPTRVPRGDARMGVTPLLDPHSLSRVSSTGIAPASRGGRSQVRAFVTIRPSRPRRNQTTHARIPSPGR